MLAVVIRKSVTAATTPAAVLFLVTATGTVSLAPSSAWWAGPAAILSVAPRDLLLMLAAGILNLVAFFSIIRGLRLTTVVHANVINASQVAMATLAGLCMFHERLTAVLAAGIAPTILGMMLVTGRQTSRPST